MNGSTQTENILDLMVETLRPVTQSIVQTVAVERDLDEDTQTLVTDTTLQVIRCLGKRFNVALQSITEHSSKEDVLSSLGCVLPPIIDKGLNIIRTEAFSPASDPLATLTTHEVTDVLTGALSGKDTAEPVKEPGVSLPGKICATIRYVLRMLKVKLQSLCSCCPPTAKIGTPQAPLKLVSVNSDSEEEGSRITTSSISSGNLETSEESTSGGNEAMEIESLHDEAELVPPVLIPEFNCGDCVTPLPPDIAPDGRIEEETEAELYFERYLKIHMVSDYIAKVTVKTESMKETGAPVKKYNFTYHVSGGEEVLGKNLLELYAKATFYETMVKLQKDLFSDCTDTRALRCHIAPVDLLFEREGLQGPPANWDEPLDQAGGESSAIMTHLLSILIPFVNDLRLQRLVRSLGSVRGPVNPSRRDLYQEATTRARSCYTTITNWFSSEAQSLVPLVMRRIEEGVQAYRFSPEGEEVLDSDDDDDDDMARLRHGLYSIVAVYNLLLRLVNKAGVKISMDQIDIRGERLFNKTWALVEGEGLDFNDEAFENLDKNVYKDLCKKIRNTNVVLELLVNGTSFEDYIAHTLKKHMTSRPKKGNKISRFFSNVRKSICKHFRK